MKVLVVYKDSRYEIYSSSRDEAVQRFLQDENNEYVMQQKKSHDEHHRSLEIVLAELDRLGLPYEALWRGDIKSIDGKDLVVSVGGDGTLIDASHFIHDSTPILGVNSDCGPSIGFSCSCDKNNFRYALENLDKLPRTIASRIQVELNGKLIPKFVLNDVLVADENPGSASDIVLNSQRAPRNNSGLLVSTAIGSTAFMYQAGGRVVADTASREMQYRYLNNRKAESCFAEELDIYSLTRKGKIFVDGQHIMYDFTIGDRIHLQTGAPLTIIGDFTEKKKKI